MSEFRHTVADFIRVSTKLLETKDVSDDEESKTPKHRMYSGKIRI